MVLTSKELRKAFTGADSEFEASRLVEPAIVALEAMETKYNASVLRWGSSSMAQKEREHARTVKALEAVESELAALRGAAVPVAYLYQYAGYETCEGFQDWREKLSREIPPEWMLETGKATGLVELFTRPAAVVVLPVRAEHAEWSQATFGNVGPVGPLKHLSKEAIEAAEAPDDLSEWADMQFLLWDAQRRAGITDAQIEQAMIEKLAINKARTWPAPKDGEPRLHVKSADGEGEA